MMQKYKGAVRTREEQAEEIFALFKGVTHTDGSQFLPHMGRHDLLHALAEAEARGAEEARRKDAEWKPIETAPRDGTAFQARIPSHGDDNIIMWDCSIEHKDGDGWGTWMFASDQEPPDCWSDGWCWTENADGDQSVLPTHWKPLPDAAMDAEER